MDDIIYMATVNAVGTVDAQVRPSTMTPEGYAILRSVMVRATINMFVAAGMSEKEATNTILKTLTRETRNTTQSATFSETRSH